jgi:hypothetical protein
VSSTPILSDISAASDGSAVGADAHGLNYKMTSLQPADSGTWESLTSSVALTHVAAASASDVWGVTSTGAVYRSQGTTWDPQPVAGTLNQLSAADDGTVWGVGAGLAYQYTGAGSNPWTQVPCQAQLTLVAVGDANGVFALSQSGQVLQYANTSVWPALTPQPPVSLVDLSVTDDGLLFGIGPNNVLYLYVGPSDPWYPAATGLTAVSAGGSSSIWALDAYGDPRLLLSGEEIFSDDTTQGDNLPRWETASVYDQTRSTHLWIVYQAATLAFGGGAEGQAATALIKPQPVSVKQAIGDPFHDRLCQGLYDADNVDPWRDLGTFFQYVPWVGKYAATYKSHFYDPDTGRNWWGDTSPTALTRGRSVAAYALDCYLAGDLPNAGYYLGLALHYLTDVTQAMHAGNFTYLSSDPWGWHSEFEGRVMQLTGTPGGVTPPSSYTSTTDTDWDSFVVTAASNSKTKYLSAICPDLVTNAVRTVIGEQLVLVRSWQTDADTLWNQNVLPSVGPMLRDAITYTAQFLVAWTTVAETGAETVFLTCLDSGEVIDVPHGFLLGTAVQQYAFNGGTNQQWMAVPLTGADAGYFRITSRLSVGPSPWVLDVAHQSLQAGAPVIVYPWNNQDNQKWKPLEAGGGTVWESKQSGYCLTVGNPSSEGSGLVIQRQGAAAGQTWLSTPVGVDTLGCAAGPLVADVPHGTGTPNTQLQLFTPNGGTNQQFVFVPVEADTTDEDDEVFALLVASSGLALDISTSNQVVQQPWSGSPSQNWRRIPVVVAGDTVVYLENRSKPGWFMSAASNGTSQSEPIVIAPSNSQATQQWRVTTISQADARDE